MADAVRRQEFEKWVRKVYDINPSPQWLEQDNRYYASQVQDAWESWQAAFEAGERKERERCAKVLKIVDEIRQIMRVYREQEASGYVDTPGGLEHMGDVWRLLAIWDRAAGD